MSAQTLINNYVNLIDSYEKATASEKLNLKNTIINLFSAAKSIKINNLNSQTKGFYYFYLGIKNQNLCGILVHSSSTPDITKIDSYSPTIYDFSSINFTANAFLKTSLTSNNTEITHDEYDKRVKRWNSSKDQLIQQLLDKNQMVKYFIIDQSNLKNQVDNNSVFGIFENTTAPKGETLLIDFITVNDAYMDRVRPVPPFRP